MKDSCILTEYMVDAGLLHRLDIGLVSDLHESNPDEVLTLLRKCSPDLIMVAGDTFERHGTGRETQRMSDEGIGSRLLRRGLMKLDDLFMWMSGETEQNPQYAYDFLRKAAEIAPVYLSLGNHEWYFLPEDLKVIRENGITLLDNAECQVDIKGITLHVGGLSSEADFEWLNEFCGKSGYKVLLCHHPEYYDRYLRSRDLNLILSGHAHGGQIRIQNHGIYSPGQGLFPRYTKGIYDGKLVVATGCSNTASVPRWGNPREVVLLHLV